MMRSSRCLAPALLLLLLLAACSAREASVSEPGADPDSATATDLDGPEPADPPGIAADPAAAGIPGDTIPDDDGPPSFPAATDLRLPQALPSGGYALVSTVGSAETGRMVIGYAATLPQPDGSPPPGLDGPMMHIFVEPLVEPDDAAADTAVAADTSVVADTAHAADAHGAGIPDSIRAIRVAEALDEAGRETVVFAETGSRGLDVSDTPTAIELPSPAGPLTGQYRRIGTVHPDGRAIDHHLTVLSAGASLLIVRSVLTDIEPVEGEAVVREFLRELASLMHVGPPPPDEG